MKILKSIIGTIAVALSFNSIATWAARDDSNAKLGAQQDSVQIEKPEKNGRTSPECDVDSKKL